MAKRKESPLVKGRLSQAMSGTVAESKAPLSAASPAASAPGQSPSQPTATTPAAVKTGASTDASRAPASLFVGSTRMIEISLLRRDDSTQGRVKISSVTVDEYADAIERGVQLPPVKVFFDGTDHWLADGFHRVEAHLEAGKMVIAAEVTPGTHEDAILYAAGPANARHGLRRTTGDKRRSIEMVLALWGVTKSDRAIADHCQVTDKTVAAVRRVFLAKLGGTAATEREGKDGRVYRLPTKPTAVAAGLDRLEKILPAAGVAASDPKPTAPADDRDTSLRSSPGGQLEDIGLRVSPLPGAAVAKVPGAPVAKVPGSSTPIALSLELRATLETTTDTLDLLLVNLPPGARLDLRTWAEEGRRLVQGHLNSVD